MDTAVILDCYTVEPSGLGVPPYLSTYVRQAWSALTAVGPNRDVRYLTIDDVRWELNGGEPLTPPPVSDPLTYSASQNRGNAIKLLRDAATVIVVAGDAVPSVHLHAHNGSLDEIIRVLACVRGRRVLLGPMANHVLDNAAGYAALFDAVHTHTITSKNVALGSRTGAAYEELRTDRDSFTDLIGQLGWTSVAEIELYRGCTRRRYCSFCNEPAKSPAVVFRDLEDILDEVRQLYAAGVRNLRLGQQTCFFSAWNRDVAQIERLLAGIRAACPALEVLHIDNADPLAVASPAGARIARLIVEHCSEGNCAPMGMESFDPAVIGANALTCTPQILRRAIDNINDVGNQRGPAGLPALLPGINIIYGLPGETHRTHLANLQGLDELMTAGALCHRTNVRQARAYPGTPLAGMNPVEESPSQEHFMTWKADIDNIWDQPMKRRVYPIGLRLRGLHSFFVTGRGTWYRRLGSYPIQVVERDAVVPRFTPADLTVTEHAPRFIYGARDAG
ncbi:radical SAM protein [Actinoplanes xinjiangensis]|uniref:Radical SAM superfamily enzyme with C-terminal helix-hairpin-helix motif n=1 Tax=Actinoplanes xinjiangensis TaxID=512350 RepID=A0A316EFA0_9ACTN|nr:radical SAM protein [Actinoplanes xinjiangensis]PWK28036.1 radical SAM superfamily enzyme with C-terminal helix-hairpin-helix motif [Actinoplanes xinjiangensis]GIF45225.1 radical SAM protein [Actinoplanes xinjiangensis]